MWDPYQDVNQQQVLGVATLGVEQVLHTEFCWIGCEAAAVPVQPVVYLKPTDKEHDHHTIRRLISVFLFTVNNVRN